MWKKHHWVMAEAGENGAGGGDGGGGTEGDGSAGNDAGSGEQGAAGQEGQQQAQGNQSVLKRGEEGGEPTPSEYIPEKFHVQKEDGTLDIEASARKMAENYGNLEKRLGTGDVPPKEASEYKIEPPESMGEYKASDDPQMQSFLAEAHKAGITQGQLDVIMQHYFQAVPQLAGAFQQVDQQQAMESLQKVWGADDKEFQRHAGLAHVAASAAAERAGVSMEEIEAAGLGNNPVFLRLMSALGSEFKEDKGAGKTSFSTFGEDDVRTLETSEAYTNPRHPEHELVSKRVRAYYERKHGTTPVA